MSSYTQKFSNKKLIDPPKFVPNSMIYETITGSHAYGTNRPDSDFDLRGICVPPKEEVFPHLKGEIIGFGRQKQRFGQFISDKIYEKDQEYEVTVFNVVKFFNLFMENNPNIVDIMFTPMNCITHINKAGHIIRENRKEFLHKGCYQEFQGYALSQLKKMNTNKENTSGHRRELREKFGFDVKFAVNIVRLSLECQQILETGDLDLQANKEKLKSILRGDMNKTDIENWFAEKEKYLEKLYETSKIPNNPNQEKIQQLLYNCLEEHFGTLDKAIVIPEKNTEILRQIKELCEKAEL